jgi:hypothetical protein
MSAFVVGGGGIAAASSSPPDSHVTALTSMSPTNDVAGCPSNFNEVPFVESNGITPEGLTVCTNGSATYIYNTSFDTVWLIKSSVYHYWAPASDRQWSAAVQLFRAGLRTTTLNPSLLYPTVEPGTDASVGFGAQDLLLEQNPGEQSAWQIATLLVDTADESSTDAALEVIEGEKGTTRNVLVSCVTDAFNIGSTFRNSGGSIDYQNSLSNDYKNVKSTKDCASKIQALVKESKKVDKDPEISIPKIKRVVVNPDVDPDWGETDSLIRDAIDDFSRFIH